MKCAVRRLLILGLLILTPALLAQIPTGGMGVAGGAHMGGTTAGGGARGGHGLGSRTVRPGVVGGFRHHGFHRNPFFNPFWSSSFWWDDGYYPQDGDQGGAQPPAPSSLAQPPAPMQEVKPINPLLIELQGDRFVRLSDNQISQPLARSSAPQQPELPPALLIFRDGHHQEVSSYAIIGPALYASGSYWTNGYWTQKILLADLDLAATLQANQQRGVNFVLPSAPDQVVTRP